MTTPHFIPVDAQGFEAEPLDRRDEIRVKPALLEDYISPEIVVNAEAAAGFFWHALAPLAVALGTLHPFEYWRGSTGQPVTAATWPG